MLLQNVYRRVGGGQDWEEAAEGLEALEGGG